MAKFDLDNYLRVRRQAVERALLAYLERHAVVSQNIWKAMRYGLFPGGKRIRPILLLAAGELFGGARSALMPFACAVEMIHAYSLIHDDLPALDDDQVRRGAPTAHIAFGEGLALLAGDGLLTEAFRLLSEPQRIRALPAQLVLELVHEISCAAGAAGLVGGQAFDLEAEQKEADLATVEYIHVRKTGALILASVRAGARIAGVKAADLRRMTRYGEFLGLAFQVADDILDAQGESASHESARNERKKATYPAVVGVVQAKERLHDLLDQAASQLDPFGADAGPLRALAHYVGAQALHNEIESINQEMHP